jgi:ABC-type sugar transport system substrate-binding protein
MTYRSLIAVALLALAITGCVQAAAAAPERRVVVVVDASAGPAALAEARAAVEAAGDGVQLRVPRTPTEQLAVTHLFAARGFDVIGVDLDRDVAVTPVAEKYSGTQFVATTPGAIAATLAR